MDNDNKISSTDIINNNTSDPTDLSSQNASPAPSPEPEKPAYRLANQKEKRRS